MLGSMLGSFIHFVRASVSVQPNSIGCPHRSLFAYDNLFAAWTFFASSSVTSFAGLDRIFVLDSDVPSTFDLPCFSILVRLFIDMVFEYGLRLFWCTPV